MKLKHKLLKIKPYYTTEDIHVYVQDLDRLIFLRDKLKDKEEQKRITDSIEVMNEVLTYMLQHNINAKGK